MSMGGICQDEQLIRENAYYVWLSKGCPSGTDLQDWLEAERRVVRPLAVASALSTSVASHSSTAPASDSKPRAEVKRAAAPAKRATRSAPAKPRAKSSAARAVKH